MIPVEHMSSYKVKNEILESYVQHNGILRFELFQIMAVRLHLATAGHHQDGHIVQTGPNKVKK